MSPSSRMTNVDHSRPSFHAFAKTQAKMRIFIKPRLCDPRASTISITSGTSTLYQPKSKDPVSTTLNPGFRT
ncbi:hypothetical protein WN55_01443 [Dufourea novaeangliae]|uniref:Uncharacterized protein n=1 Tax=Dufourea novaeangliae TaxID=178035 RepID=A0A154PEU7_DUFNO|nr:hypothetical protein WN55_01443 [Dufourea novaeangliae]